ncbi:MAG: PAS domain S-box protein [Thioalkalivibrionaceae bacterium]
MTAYPIPVDEERRLQAVHRLQLSRLHASGRLDPITRLAQDLAETPIALISIVEDERQCFISPIGLGDLKETPREISFCAHAILELDSPMIVTDARLDPRFADNPLVSGDTNLRFYLGTPIVISLTKRGAPALTAAETDLRIAVGTLCVIDTRPREADDRLIRRLSELAATVAGMLAKNIELSQVPELERRREEARHQTLSLAETVAAPIIRIDAYGHIEYANQATCNLFGYTLDDLIGRNVRMLMPQDIGLAHDGYVARYLDTREARVIGKGREVTGRHRDGHDISLHLSVSHVKTDGRDVFYGVLQDLTELHAARDQQFRQARLARAILDGTRNPIYAADRDGRYILGNAACVHVTGQPLQDIIGKTAFDVFPTDIAEKARLADEAVLNSNTTTSVRVAVPSANGLLEFELLKSPLPGDDGAPDGVVTVAHDITDLQRANREIHETERLRALSQRIARIGSWAMDLDRGEMTWSAEALFLMGVPLDDIAGTPPPLEALIHPEDLDHVTTALDAVINEQSSTFDVEFRAQLGRRRIRAHGEVDSSVGHRRLIGILQDVSDLRRAETDRARQARLLESLRLATTRFLAAEAPEKVWEFLLATLLDITDSPHGFIGETVVKNGVRCVKIHAITDISWSEESRELYRKLRDGDMLLCGQDSLIGQVVRDGIAIRTDDVINDPRAGGLPPGHPPLTSYLGMPLFQADEIIGMFGISGRAEGYDDALIETLSPFSATYAVLITALRDRIAIEQQQQQLREALAVAEQANRAKSEFLSNMSHELRTPLNAVIGFSQLLLASTKEPPSDKQRRQLENIKTSGEHLLSLINDVLDLAKIEAGKLTLSIEPVELAPVLQEALTIIRPMADRHAIAVHDHSRLTQTELDLWVRTDRVRLRQVLINLLSNAIKYNRADGKVFVTCHIAVHDDKHCVTLEIQDTGIGIPDERQNELFKPFSRMGQEAGAIEGTGIGLVITRELVRCMNGDISFESEVGVGSTFRVHLPLDQCSRIPDQLTAFIADRAAWPGDEANAGSEKRRLVLYIEDNTANIELMNDIFDEIDDMTLIVERHAEGGIHAAREFKPAAILMDINLPGLSGTAAARLLRSQSTTAHIPIIAITANATEHAVQEGRANPDFVAYLTKPIKIDATLSTLREIIRSAETPADSGHRKPTKQ